MLSTVRGGDSLASFSRTLDLSYTFVRSLVNGTRHPSDPVVKKIASKLGLEPDQLLLAAHCDRSPDLSAVLKGMGLDVDDLDPVPSSRLNGQGAGPSRTEYENGVLRPAEVRHSYGESG
jgi:hypothetical protein